MPRVGINENPASQYRTANTPSGDNSTHQPKTTRSQQGCIMTPRRKRAAWIIGALIALSLVTFFVVNAFRQNLVFFYSPTQIIAGEAPQNSAFRVGGMVAENSLARAADGVTMQFIITDTAQNIPVQYRGILPDLFKEGKGVVAQGRWENGTFISPAKYSPNMTKTICRPKRKKRSIKRISRQPTTKPTRQAKPHSTIRKHNDW
ncbi:cytochrome c maturation protein CcmE [Deefgea sp. CFH1-16]|uniref:cytochrome c maturation protein CcmE n=1 Tax=Deefgea sp. CFH1-16 TaxID=2675457 RepID=UPI001FFDD389|nr:cytochrome c maturation protein CcmE [Deefgea sp. CFH1-16]